MYSQFMMHGQKNIKLFRTKYVLILTFSSRWPILSPPKILTFPPESDCVQTQCFPHREHVFFFFRKTGQ